MVDVLVEKPLCASLEEAEQVLAAAKAYDRVIQVGHVEHFNPVMSYLEKAAYNPRYMIAERLGPYNARNIDTGVVLDLMIHDIGIVLALAKSPVRRIDSLGINVLSKTEDIANARLEFESGCVANLNASRISIKPNREIRIFQEDAYLSLDFMNQKGHLIKKSDIIAYGLKLKIGLAKAGDSSAIPVYTIPIERGEPLAMSSPISSTASGRRSSRRSGRSSASRRSRSRSGSPSRSARRAREMGAPPARRGDAASCLGAAPRARRRFLSTVLIARALGPEGRGLYAWILTLVGLAVQFAALVANQSVRAVFFGRSGRIALSCRRSSASACSGRCSACRFSSTRWRSCRARPIPGCSSSPGLQCP